MQYQSSPPHMENLHLRHRVPVAGVCQEEVVAELVAELVAVD